MRLLLTLAALIVAFPVAVRAESPKPLKALLICGGCCHDYDSQKELIADGLRERAHIDVTVVHQGGNATDAQIPLYSDPDWAEGYDVILHDECFAETRDREWLERILAPHRAGIPAVVIHCAMHCYRVDGDEWFEFCGVTSHGHGPHYPHEVRNVAAEHPIMDRFPAAWFNPAGELYRIERVWPTATPLGTAKDRENGQDQVCVWTNNYRGTRVFGTTLGHHNQTIVDPVFMDMLTRGTLWAAGKLEPAGNSESKGNSKSDNDSASTGDSEWSYLKPVAARREPINEAQGKPVTASSEETPKNNLASHAVDADRTTRWCAAGASAPQWLQIDLGEPQPLAGVRLHWESESGVYQYRVEGSNDGQQFETLVDRSENDQTRDLESFDPATARFVRVTFLGSAQGSWASLWEVEVFGARTREVNPAAAAQAEEQASLQQVTAPPEFETTLFAAPPAVNYPVYVAAAADGTVYVSSDKNGSLDREPRRGSIVRLRDLDGDGRADQSQLYVDDVDSPRGLVWDHDRLYLLHPPHLSAFIDHDGDGHSDEQQILVRDLAFTFKDRPADHTSNGVTLGIDGWLYLAIGDFGFMQATGADGRQLQMRGGGVVRVRPDGTGLEIYSRGTRNILEVAVDPRLAGFARDNTNDGGGWDIRLHHFSGLENHGYPTLYKNFADEAVAPLADYGGGSGCGALFLAEPGYPAGYGRTLYTADWGRAEIFRHNPVPQGATYEVDQESFLRLPRATDLDVDAQGRVYAASWHGATFTYTGEDVGFVVRVQPKGHQPPPAVDFPAAGIERLLTLLRGDSHRRRLAAQRELLRRHQSSDAATAAEIHRGFAELARDADASLDSRIAGIFALAQASTAEGRQTLVELCSDPTVAAWAVRAVGEWSTEESAAATTDEALRVVGELIGSSNPRARLEAIVAAARLGGYKGETSVQPTEQERRHARLLAPRVATRLGDDDDLVRHTAIAALQAIEGWEASLKVIDDREAEPRAREAALRVLAGLHHAEVVQALSTRLKKTTDRQQRQGLLAALSRLHFVEGRWDGSSWGTRPDTRGPYYQPETWELSERIAQLLRGDLAASRGEEAVWLAHRMIENRLDPSSAIDHLVQLAASDSAVLQGLPSILARAGQVPASAATLLTAIALDAKRPLENRTAAIELLADAEAPAATEAALRGLAAVAKEWEGPPTEQLLKRIVNSGKVAGNLEVVARVALEHGPAARFADACLVLWALGEGAAEAQDQAAENVEQAWADASRRGELMQAIERANLRSAGFYIHRAATDPELAQQAERLIQSWNLEAAAGESGPPIAGMDRAAVIAKVTAQQGDANRGRLIFAQLGCAKCHTVAAGEPLRGPFLPNVARTYRRDQLAEAVLLPSKSIAQGFAQNIFLMDDGRVLSGFVIEEAPEQVRIRDAEGRELKIPVEEIEQRAEKPISVMPEGLADPLSVQAVSDLVSYLESLK